MEVKAFKSYTSWINYSLVNEDIRVTNNYTIQFLFQKWTPYVLQMVLTTYIYTPWPVWKWAVNDLKTMNMSEAYLFGQKNITTYMAPYWSLSPFYLTYISPSALKFTLVPQNLLNAWAQVFPFNDWNYYDPTIVELGTTSNTQTLEYIMAGKIDYTGAVLSEAQLSIVNSTSGYSTLTIPAYNTIGFAINPWVYPYSIPQVREALCYAINRTAVAAAWGLSLAKPDYYPEPVVPETVVTFPPSVRQFIIPCSYDPAKAAQILQSLGFYKKGGYWYTPNGTQLKLMVTDVSGWTDWDTMGQAAVEQLDAFGINSQLLTIDSGVFWSDILPNGQYQGIMNGLANAPSYSTMWIWTNWPWWEEGNAISAGTNHSVFPFQWPNGTCTPVIVPISSTVPNGTIVNCINSTLGYINLTNWQSYATSVSPGSSSYDLALSVIFAWFHYYVPILPLYDKYWPFEFSYSIMDPGWLFLPYVYDNYPGLLAVFLEYQPWGYGNQPFSVNTWGLFAPKGLIPPVAQA
ncbi:ABC transporter substrate-binding protein, partial [Caldivirga sp. UBA161]|uniref:ABC transporter substrate-binding protein n=1 Tax=Caldivirga sp. UBA161 TaxID=1915569 RepID=UPI003BB8D8E5